MSAHEELRVAHEAEPGHLRVSASLVADLLAEYDEACSRRTEGGPVTGSRAPQPPGQWANTDSSTPPLTTPALADYTVPRPDERTT